MSGLVTVLTMSALLGAASFGIGILPLSFSFSSTSSRIQSINLIQIVHSLEPTLAKLTTFGTGLLLGAALGVIIPECVRRPLSLFCAD